MRTGTLLLAYLAFVVYGSLVPLEFNRVPFDVAWQQFRDIPYLALGLESRADWIANGVLYFPLGALLATALNDAVGRWRLALGALALLCCVVLAVGVEFAQLFFPPRTVSLNDLVAELIGSTIGIALAGLLRAWTDRVRHAWAAGGARFTHRALEVYAIAYVALSFFPYDLLLSWQELLDKLASPAWGWVLADDDRGTLLALLRLVIEAVMVMPLGFLWTRRAPIGAAELRRAAWLGLCLGVAIELGQFLLASGVSQGASVLTRAAGLAAGLWLAERLSTRGPDDARALLRRWTWILAPCYGVLLVAVNGWFRRAWHGLEGVVPAWAETRLLPFYYHYFTSEAAALFSLGSVALMYAPIALFGWAHGLRTATTLAMIVGVALVVECSKLFITDMHPDPTNLLIAPAAAWIALAVAALSARTLPSTAGVSQATRQRRSLAWIGLLALPLALYLGWHFPAFPVLLTTLLAGSAIVVWFVPLAALAIIPAALPLLDFAPWSGRFFCDEFDLVMAVCIGVAGHRSRPAVVRDDWSRMMALAFALLALSLALSTLRALIPWQAIDANSFSNYYSAYNAIRIVKGAAWAGAFIVLFHRLGRSAEQRERAFGAGMLVGLAFSVGWIVWERAAFVGLFDFSTDFRVSGPFSAMHKGGAYVECYLALASAFGVAFALRARHWAAKGTGLVLLLLTSYAVMVTYSRNGYAAFLVAVVGTLALEGLGATATQGRRLAARAVVVLAVGAAAIPVLLGSFAAERMARVVADLAQRQMHWNDALALRGSGWGSVLFGEGIGRFPQAHYWRSKEPERAASYRLVRVDGNDFIRLAPGATLYVEQVLRGVVDTDLTVELDVRALGGAAEFEIALCHKWLLSSQGCTRARVAVLAASRAAAWQHIRLPLHLDRLEARPGYAAPPITFALATPTGSRVVEVDNVTLRTPQGIELLDNGGFADGFDRWFFTTDVDPPWHIHSLPLALLFDQGWLGVLAGSMLLAALLVRGITLLRARRALVPAAWVGAMAFLVCGSLNTLIDSPRFLWLLLVLAWLGTVGRRSGSAR